MRATDVVGPVTTMRRARIGAVAVASAFLLNGFGFGNWAARIPAIRDQAALGETQLGFAILAAGVGAVLTMSLGGRLGSRYGTHVMTALTLLGCAVMEPALASSSNFAMLAGSLFLFGIAQGTMDVCMNANGLAVERAGVGPIMSRLHASWSVGMFAGATTGGIAAGLGVTVLAQFIALAVVQGAGALWLWFAMLPDVPRTASTSPGFRLPPPRLLALGAVAFCGLLAEGSASDWGGLYATSALGATQEMGAFVVASFGLAMFAARFAGDHLVVLLGARRLVVGGGALSTAGLGLALVVATPPAAVAGYALMGLGLAAIVPVTFRAGGSQPGIASAVGIAAVSTMGYAGGLAGPPIIGLLAGAIGLRTALAIVLVLLGALVFIASRTLRMPAQLSSPEPAVPEEIP